MRDTATGQVGVVDAPEAGPIEAALQRGLGSRPDPDHPPPRRPYRRGRCAAERIRGRGGRCGGGRASAAAARHRAGGGRPVALGESVADVIDVPGHTVGHVAYHFAEAGGAVLGRQPDGDGMRPAVRGNARADVGEPVANGGAAGRHAGLLRPRIRREQRPVRAVGRRRATRRCERRARRSTRCVQIGAADGAGADGPRAGDQPVPAGVGADFKARNGLEALSDAQVFAEIRRRKDSF